MRKVKFPLEISLRSNNHTSIPKDNLILARKTKFKIKLKVTVLYNQYHDRIRIYKLLNDCFQNQKKVGAFFHSKNLKR